MKFTNEETLEISEVLTELKSEFSSLKALEKAISKVQAETQKKVEELQKIYGEVHENLTIVRNKAEILSSALKEKYNLTDEELTQVLMQGIES